VSKCLSWTSAAKFVRIKLSQCHAGVLLVQLKDLPLYISSPLSCLNGCDLVLLKLAGVAAGAAVEAGGDALVAAGAG